MSKKYIYPSSNILQLLGKRSEKENTDSINQCLVAGRKSTLALTGSNPRHKAKIEHYNKVIKALPEQKLAEYIRAFIMMD